MHSQTQPSRSPREAIVFQCPSCALKLSASPDKAGVTGPCPSCGNPVTAPEHAGDVVAEVAIIPPSLGPIKSSRNGRRILIQADAAVDQRHLDRRETGQTMLVIVAFILLVCTCYGIYWFLADSMTK